MSGRFCLQISVRRGKQSPAKDVIKMIRKRVQQPHSTHPCLPVLCLVMRLLCPIVCCAGKCRQGGGHWHCSGWGWKCSKAAEKWWSQQDSWSCWQWTVTDKAIYMTRWVWWSILVLIHISSLHFDLNAFVGRSWLVQDQVQVHFVYACTSWIRCTRCHHFTSSWWMTSWRDEGANGGHKMKVKKRRTFSCKSFK